mmetsp:Transcript_24710/g.69178  ORF Transcript_24710/g.69178 Transcript_24710/m.69178 type:complete len:235 (-) Transcript_24710:594-1298(-)
MLSDRLLRPPCKFTGRYGVGGKDPTLSFSRHAAPCSAALTTAADSYPASSMRKLALMRRSLFCRKSSGTRASHLCKPRTRARRALPLSDGSSSPETSRGVTGTDLELLILRLVRTPPAPSRGVVVDEPRPPCRDRGVVSLELLIVPPSRGDVLRASKFACISVPNEKDFGMFSDILSLEATVSTDSVMALWLVFGGANVALLCFPCTTGVRGITGGVCVVAARNSGGWVVGSFG